MLGVREVFAYCARIVRPFRSYLLVMVWVSSMWAVNLSVNPYLVKVMLNRIAEENHPNIIGYLLVPVLLYLGMMVIMTLSFRLYNYCIDITMIPQLRARIANDSVGALVEKSHDYYHSHFSGSLANKINDLMTNVPELLQIIFDRFLATFLSLGVAMYALSRVHIQFTLLMLGWIIFFFIGVTLSAKYLARQADDWSEWTSKMTGKMVDILSNILFVRLFSSRRKEKQDFQKNFQFAVSAEQRLQWSYFWLWLGYGVSCVVLQALNFYFLLKGRQAGFVSVGDFALVLMINFSILDFFWQIAQDFSQFSKVFGKITQALRVILIRPEMEDPVDAKSLRISQGEIVFERVKFHYKNSEILFRDKTVTIQSGQKVGLVGYSGSGKSTFVNLILRLYDITGGHILIDGQDVRAVTQDSLRANIGMIPQDPSLFHRTLMENIRYGSDHATDEQVISAAKRAHAHDFILKCSEGYETVVGERGVKLSGGQRQRIAIARAILKNAPILILDEATSQLDSATEADIQESLWELMQDKTTLVIAHRLSTLLNMDRILVFDRGKIVQDGTHDELFSNQEGLYYALWTAQVGGFLPEQYTISTPADKIIGQPDEELATSE